MKNPLGKLMRVDLREYWEDEAREFTPWLAQQENLQLLGDSIGIGLELVGTERPVAQPNPSTVFQVCQLACRVEA
jgi:hypothetical protein